jgi:hypothetical protein
MHGCHTMVSGVAVSFEMVACMPTALNTCEPFAIVAASASSPSTPQRRNVAENDPMASTL